ncbi:hypothetical protein HanPSC8_Chr07g0303291 [Helianthus annuus]|nr:hypothetical protein HanPSC8_Chr07g0303291 [Helianthus annuus]
MDKWKSADVLLWKRRVFIGHHCRCNGRLAIFERSGLSFLTITDSTLPELSCLKRWSTMPLHRFRIKVNYLLLMAHDITLARTSGSFSWFVVGFLWLLSVLGSVISFFTLAYIGTILSVTLPALYNKYEEQVDRCAGTIQRSFSRHYKIVDENVMNRIPRSVVPKDKPM